MNPLTAAFQAANPNDPRSADEITAAFGAENDQDGRYSNVPGFAADYANVKAQNAILNPPPGPISQALSQAGAGFSAGVSGMESTAAGLGALAAGGVGASGTRDALLAKYQSINQDAAQNTPPTNPTIQSIKDPQGAVNYAAYTAGQLLPNLGEALLFSVGGAAAGSAFGPEGTAAGAETGLLGGFATREAAEGILDAVIKKGAKGIANEGLSAAYASADDAVKATVQSQLKAIVNREALPSLNPLTENMLASEVKSVAKKYGALSANIVNFAGLGAGEEYGQAATTPGVSDNDAKIAALIAGVGSSAGALLPTELTSKLFPGVEADAAQTYIKRVAQNAAKEIPLGAVGMGMMEIGNIAAERYANGKLNDPLSNSDLSRILNAAAIGVGAGAVGSLGASIAKPPEFNDIVDRYFKDVVPERRQQIFDMANRVNSGVATPQDITSFRTLSPQEANYYNAVGGKPPEEATSAAPPVATPTPAVEPTQKDMEYPGGEMPPAPASPTPNERTTTPTDTAAAVAEPPTDAAGVQAVSPTPASEKPPVSPAPAPNADALRSASVAQAVPPREDPAVSAARARLAEAGAKPEELPAQKPTPDPSWAVRVQAPEYEDGKLASNGYVQIGDSSGKEWSKGPVALTAEGYSIPDFSKLPSGQYTYAEAEAKLAAMSNATEGTKPAETPAIATIKGWRDTEEAIRKKSDKELTAIKAGNYDLSDIQKYVKQRVSDPKEAQKIIGLLYRGAPTSGAWVEGVGRLTDAITPKKSDAVIRDEIGERIERLNNSIRSENGKANPSAEMLEFYEKERDQLANKLKTGDSEAVAAPKSTTPEAKSINPTDFVDVENRGTHDVSGRGAVKNIARDAWEEHRATHPNLSPWEELTKKAREHFVDETPGLAEKLNDTRKQVLPAWQKLDPADRDVESVGGKLLSQASPADPYAPNATTHGLAVVRNNVTGEHHIVSAFESNNQTRLTNFDPSLGKKGAKSLTLDKVLGAKTEDGKNKYDIVARGRTKEPTSYFQHTYPDEASSREQFEKPLDERTQEVQKTAEAQGAHLAEGAKFRPEGESIPKEPTSGDDEHEADEPSVGPEFAHEPEPLNLKPEEVNQLVKTMPEGTTVGDMLDILKEHPEMGDLFKKIALADREFFGRVEQLGIEKALKEYGYKADTGTAGQVESGTAGHPENDVRNTGLGAPAGTSGPEAGVAGEQDRSGEQGQAGAGGDEKPDRESDAEAVKTSTIPDWAREEMVRQGLNPGRTFNDVDLGNPYVRDAISNDPTLTEAQKDSLLETGALPKTGEEPVKQTTPTPTGEPAPTPEQQAQHLQTIQSIHEALTAAGVDTKLVKGELPGGAYSPANHAIVQTISDVVGRQDVKNTFHEAAHAAFAKEEPEGQSRLLKAVDSMSDEALGVDTSADTRIRSNDPANLGKAGVNEERLVDHAAESMVRQGFKPEEAKGFAQQFVRQLKDYYLRAAMSVQRMLGLKENPELATRYFENRLKMMLAGDTSRSSYLDWLGLGKPSTGARLEQWFPHDRASTERFDEYGNVEYDHQPDLSGAASQFNQDNALKYTKPDLDPGYSRTTEIEKRAAVLNRIADDIHVSAVEAMKIPEFKEAAAKVGETPDAFLRSLVKVADPNDAKLLLADAKEPSTGESVKYDPDKTINDFKHPAQQDAVTSQAYRNVTAMVAKVARAKFDAEDALPSLVKRHEDMLERYNKAKEDYTDLEGQTSEAVKAMRKEGNRLFAAIKDNSRDAGVIGQQLKELDPKGTLKDYAPAFQKLFTGDQLKGEKLSHLLDTLANDPAIDFTKPVSAIKTDIEESGLDGTKPYQSLMGNTKESNALLATVAAFAKTHEKTMAELELRREKNGVKREQIQKDAAHMAQGKRDFIKSFGALAKGAKMEERMRVAHRDAVREMRAARRAVDRATLKSKVADAIVPLLRDRQADLAEKLKLSSDFVFRHDAPYNVPAAPDAKSEDVIKLESIKKLKLDSSGVVTNPKDVEGDLAKMAAFINHREGQYQAGDLGAKDAIYQGVKRQFREIAENKNFKTSVGPAQRFMLELGGTPVGKRMAEAFGTPAARMIDRMVNHYTTLMNEFRPESERVGRVNDQLENKLLQKTTGTTKRMMGWNYAHDRDWLRDNVLNPAKKVMGKQHDLEELYADKPESLKRAIYQRVREQVLEKPYLSEKIQNKDEFMSGLQTLLEHQREANKWQQGLVERANTGVLDPKLKTFNPATGEFESGVRRHIPVGEYTFSQRLHRTFKSMVNGLKNSDWASLGDTIHGEPDEEGNEGHALADAYNRSPDEAEKMLDPFFNDVQHRDAVGRQFFGALANMDNESPFEAPAEEDAITRQQADPALVQEAFQKSGPDPVKFAENLYDLHEGTSDKGMFVQRTVEKLNNIFNEIDGMQRKVEPTGSDLTTAIRGMTPDALIDARRIEHLPADWFDYHSFDQRDMSKMSERIASQSAFGRGQERLGSAFDTVGKEVASSNNRLTSAIEEARAANPGAKQKVIDAAVKSKLGGDYDKIKTQVARSSMFNKSIHELSDYFRRDNAPDGTLRAITRAAQTLGNLMVNQPASAITRMANLFDVNLRYGASNATLKTTGQVLGYAGKEIAHSLAQAVGYQMKDGSWQHQMWKDLGQTDPEAVKKFSDAFDRLQGESAASHFFRAVNEITGTTMNRVGTEAEHTVLRPFQPFTTADEVANYALTKGVWNLTKRHIDNGVEFYKNNPEKLADPTHDLDSGVLKLRGADKDSFERLTGDMSKWGMNYDDMVRKAIADPEKKPFSTSDAQRLYSMMMAEVSNESSIATMPLWAYNNSLARFALPLMGWSFRRMMQVGSLRLNPEGELEMKSLGRGMAGLGVMAIGSLGIGSLVDQYYSGLLGKQRNLRPVLGAQDPKDAALGVLEQLNRVGTLGMFGELANGLANVGQRGDNRQISVDQRVVAVSAFESIQSAISAWINQGFDADYNHVVRPLASALGGGAALQYMQLANHTLGLDNPESRTNARLNAQNYLRTAGRSLDMDVRQSDGGVSNPTPLSPYLTKMELATYAGDQGDFRQAYSDAVQQAKEMGNADPVDQVKRAFASRNPLRSVFSTPPTEVQYKQLLGAMGGSGATDVSEALANYNKFSESIGATPFTGKKEKAATKQPSAFGNFPQFGNRIKNAALAGIGQ